MIYFKVIYFGIPHIEEVEVEKETERSVWVKGKPCRKDNRYEHYFKTYEGATGFILDKAKEKWLNALNYVHDLEKKYDELLIKYPSSHE